MFGNVELRHYNVYNTFGELALCYLSAIFNSSSCNSFIFKVCITIVHTLKMYTGDAGPEQSLGLF